MSFLKKLFGGGEPAAPKPVASVEIEGYLVETFPQAEGGQFRLCGVISKEINGEKKSHTLIRADMLPSVEAASDAAINKARQVIDEQGEGLLG